MGGFYLTQFLVRVYTLEALFSSFCYRLTVRLEKSLDVSEAVGIRLVPRGC
jgi:hypothetical protein